MVLRIEIARLSSQIAGTFSFYFAQRAFESLHFHLRRIFETMRERMYVVLCTRVVLGSEETLNPMVTRKTETEDRLVGENYTYDDQTVLIW